MMTTAITTSGKYPHSKAGLLLWGRRGCAVMFTDTPLLCSPSSRRHEPSAD